MPTMPVKPKPVPRGRQGGRKPKYDEPTVPAACRLPQSVAGKLMAAYGSVGQGLVAVAIEAAKKIPSAS